MGARKGTKVPVSVRAAVQRINRKLREEDQVLRKTRGGVRAKMDLGEWFVLDVRRNLAGQTHVDVEELAREMGVLRPWEVLAEEAER